MDSFYQYMNQEIPIYIVISANAVIILCMVSVYLFLTNTKRMMQKGYKEEYIVFEKRTLKNDMIGAGILLFVIQAVCAILLRLLEGTLTAMYYFEYVLMTSMIGPLCYQYYRSRKNFIQYKKLAIKTKSDVIIDFNYSVLHVLFNLPMEIVSSLFVVAYNACRLHFSPMVFLYLAVMWSKYLGLKRSKNLTRPLFRDFYLQVGKSFILLHIILIMLLVMFTSRYMEVPEWSDYLIISILGFVLLVKLIFYVIRYSRFKQNIDNAVGELDKSK